MLPRASLVCWSKSQSGQNTPDKNFFDSDNFHLLELTRQRQAETEEKARLRVQRSRREALVEKSSSPELGYYSRLFGADGNPKPSKTRAPAQEFYGLRKPLNAQEQRVVAALPGWEKDHKEWTDKPYSTVFTGPLGYTGHFPLLMHINSDSEDKDVTVIQTETRRRSLVTTNYASGTIQLESNEEDIKYAVFPILHVVVESESEEDDFDTTSNSEDTGDETRRSTPKDRPPPLLPQDVLQRLAAIAARSKSDEDDGSSEESEDAEAPPGWFEHAHRRLHDERRLSITTRPCAEKPRTLKRRSLDFGSLFYHHEVENMDTIDEDAEASGDDDDDDAAKIESGMATTMKSAPAGNWAKSAEAKERDAGQRDLSAVIRRAELEMDQMELKLEDFLERDSSDDSQDDVA